MENPTTSLDNASPTRDRAPHKKGRHSTCTRGNAKQYALLHPPLYPSSPPRRDRSSLPHLPALCTHAGLPAGHCNRPTAPFMSAISSFCYMHIHTYMVRFLLSPADQQRLHPPSTAFSLPAISYLAQSHVSLLVAPSCPNAQITQAGSAPAYIGPGPPRPHDHHKPRPSPASTCSKNPIITWQTNSCRLPYNLRSWYRILVSPFGQEQDETIKQITTQTPMQNATCFSRFTCLLISSYHY